MRAWLPARGAAIGHRLALESEAFGERPAEKLRLIGVVDIVPCPLAGGGSVQDMVHVVVPLRGVLRGARTTGAYQPRGSILLVLQDQVQVAIAHACPGSP